MSDLVFAPSHSSVVVFDAYGTLLDVHSAVGRLAARIGPEAARLSHTWRGKQLEYSWVLSLLARYEPFWTLTERALDFALACHAPLDPTVRGDLLAAYRELAPYPDASAVLSDLRRRQARVAVLSNGDPAMLEAGLSSAGLTDRIDAVLSVDEVRIFKTSPQAYQLVLDRFAVAREEVLFVSSNRWDVAGAVAFGFDSVWVNRSGLPEEYPALRPLAVLSDLSAVSSLLG